MLNIKNNFIGLPPKYPIKPIGPLCSQNNTNNFNNKNIKQSEILNKSINLSDYDFEEITHPFEKTKFLL